MPRKKTHQPPPPPPPPIHEDYPDPNEGDFLPDIDDEPEPEPASARVYFTKKKRNAHTRTAHVEHSSPESSAEEPIESLDPPRSPSPNHGSLRHVSPSTYGKSRPVNIRDELTATEKVSDQYTPPSDSGLANDVYSRSPPSAAVSSAANTPPVEPGFSLRQAAKPRSPPVSPPRRSVRPLSFGANGPPLPAYSRPSYSNYCSPPAAAPLPHLPQSHFYAARDIDIGIPQHGQIPPVKEPIFTKLAQLSTLASETKHGIIFGYGGRVDICSFDGTSIAQVGALSALPGTIVDAELLHWTSGTDPFTGLRPLLAVTRMIRESNNGGGVQHSFVASVYSISQRRLVCDLLQTMPEQPLQTLQDPALINLPSCHLQLKADGNFLTLSSGKSGELFVFSPTMTDTGPAIECLGKFWTSIQPKEPRRESSQYNATPEMLAINSKKVIRNEDVPIMSIAGRWLAVCPPVAASRQTIGAVIADGVLVRSQAGLEATSPGTRPAVSCEVDSPDADTLFGKMARGVAQEVMKASKWLGDQGMQAWQNYWKREDAPAASLQPAVSHTTYQNSAQYGQFPPTHADANKSTRDPEIVAVFDLKAISDLPHRKPGALAPIATFQPPHGCSFLSFAPHGLMLLSASRKGDYQYVWDLLEMRHTRAVAAEVDNDRAQSVPRVRQLARFDRLSSSVIVDAVWETPSLRRLAILTKNKTVHLFDLPASALRWPPPRNLKKDRPISAPPTGGSSVEHDAAPPGGFFASAINFAGRTQPMLANLKGRAPNTGGGLTGIGQAGFGIATATGARGSKAVAAGLSKSLGAATETVSRLQHAGDNKLHLKSGGDVSAARLIWLWRGAKAGICVLNDDGFRYYQVRRSKARDPQSREATVFEARRALLIKTPNLTTVSSIEDGIEACPGFWNLRTTQAASAGNVHPLSFAEIDTNAPFQPFHSDRRVTLSVFEPIIEDLKGRSKSAKSKSVSSDRWVFGDEIHAVKINIISTQSSHDEHITGSVIYRETSVTNDDANEDEHIVSTTRKKKPKRGIPVHAGDMVNEVPSMQEGFFEDDCDVLDFATDRV